VESFGAEARVRHLEKVTEKWFETIRQLIAYGGWANARILTAVSPSSRRHQKALHLLAHLLVSEKIWLLRLKGE
jgi:uncharacterized damage-inducible protein DinB